MRFSNFATLTTPIVLGLFGAAALLSTGAGTQSTESALKPVAPRDDLMHWHDRAFGQVRLGIAQKDAEKAKSYAWLLAELANVNTQHSDDPKYKELAGKLRDGMVAVAEAIEKEEFDKAKQLAMDSGKNCKSCHDAFKKDDH